MSGLLCISETSVENRVYCGEGETDCWGEGFQNSARAPEYPDSRREGEFCLERSLSETYLLR